MKTYLLGCGAQKAGTTWLSDNLSNSNEYWDGGLKEWRFWSPYFDQAARLRFNISSRIKLLLRTKESLSKRSEWRRSALKDPELFLQNTIDHFNATKNIKVLGDLTPLNGTLEPNKLSVIKERFESNDIAVKPVFIMRDPYERIWSAARMEIKNKYPDHLNDEQFLVEKILSIYRSELVEKRTRYERTIENLEKVFDKEDIYYEFSERLFAEPQKSLDRITHHLGIQNLVADVNVPNPSPKRTAVPEEVKLEIVSYYQGTYEAIYNKFGDEVRALWNESFDLLQKNS